jgi:hypothetical protein
LFYETIIVRFDIPLLFTCKDEQNNRYLVVCSDEEIGEYVVVAITVGDLLKMLRDEMPMYDAFRSAAQAFLIKYDFDNDVYDCNSKSQTEISDNMLPDKGAYLRLKNKKIVKYIEELKAFDKKEHIEIVSKTYTSQTDISSVITYECDYYIDTPAPVRFTFFNCWDDWLYEHNVTCGYEKNRELYDDDLLWREERSYQLCVN